MTSSTIVLGEEVNILNRVEYQLQPGQYIEEESKNYVMRCTVGPKQRPSIGTYSIYIYHINKTQTPIAGLVKERDGKINDCWLGNIDADKNPKVLIFSTSVGSGSYGKLDMFELDGTQLKQIELPTPPRKFMEGYMGHDLYEVVEGKIFRTFPIYLEEDSNCCPRGGYRTLEFDNTGEHWKLSNRKNADDSSKQ